MYLESQESLPSSTPSPAARGQARRVHAEHFTQNALSSLRVPFALDIPSDASPAFQITSQPPQSRLGLESKTTGGKGGGGLEWRVRLCLHVAVAHPQADLGTEGVAFKVLERDDEKGEWGSSWRALPTLCPLERIAPPSSPSPSSSSPLSPPQSQSWSSFFTSTLLGTTSPAPTDDAEQENDWDGVRVDERGEEKGVNFAGEEEGWRNVRMETVECEVSVRVWPGNTAFKPTDVVFDV